MNGRNQQSKTYGAKPGRRPIYAAFHSRWATDSTESSISTTQSMKEAESPLNHKERRRALKCHWDSDVEIIPTGDSTSGRECHDDWRDEAQLSNAGPKQDHRSAPRPSSAPGARQSGGHKRPAVKESRSDACTSQIDISSEGEGQLAPEALSIDAQLTSSGPSRRKPSHRYGVRKYRDAPIGIRAPRDSPQPASVKRALSDSPQPATSKGRLDRPRTATDNSRESDEHTSNISDAPPGVRPHPCHGGVVDGFESSDKSVSDIDFKARKVNSERDGPGACKPDDRTVLSTSVNLRPLRVKQTQKHGSQMGQRVNYSKSTHPTMHTRQIMSPALARRGMSPRHKPSTIQPPSTPITVSPMRKVDGTPLAPRPRAARKIRGRLSFATCSARRDRTLKLFSFPDAILKPCTPKSDHETGSEWEQDWDDEDDLQSHMSTCNLTELSNAAVAVVHETQSLIYKTRHHPQTGQHFHAPGKSPLPLVTKRKEQRRRVIIVCDSDSDRDTTDVTNPTCQPSQMSGTCQPRNGPANRNTRSSRAHSVLPMVVIPQISTPQVRRRTKAFRHHVSPLRKPCARSPIALSPMLKINGVPLALTRAPVRNIRGRISMVTSSARRNTFRPFMTQAGVEYSSACQDASPGCPDTQPSELEPRKVKSGTSGRTSSMPAVGQSLSDRSCGPFRAPASQTYDTYSTPAKPTLVGPHSNYHLPSPYVYGPSPVRRPVASIILQGLSSLLNTCGQSAIYDFDSTLTNPPRSIVNATYQHQRLREGRWSKIAEATFSEVYGWTPPTAPKASCSTSVRVNTTGAFVMKVVPIKRSTKASKRRMVTKIVNQDYADTKEGADEFPCETEWMDAEKEIKLAQLLGLTSEDGFIDFRGALVVSGSYPPVLLQKWKDYQKKNPDKVYNPNPGKFSQGQLYCCILSGQAGEDLESFRIKNWQEAASVLSQVLHTLSRAERDHHFEHRDLHWGNITVQRHEVTNSLRASIKGKGRARGDQDECDDNLVKLLAETSLGPKNATQLKVTILDFGLSRAEVHVGKRQTEVIWTDPDPDIFGGTGAEDYQFECYDLMKKSMEGKKWSEFNPFSTIIWLHYLCRKLIEEKGLVAPGAPKQPGLEHASYKLLQNAERVLEECISLELDRHQQVRKTRRTTSMMLVTESKVGNLKSANTFLEWWKVEQDKLLSRD